MLKRAVIGGYDRLGEMIRCNIHRYCCRKLQGILILLNHFLEKKGSVKYRMKNDVRKS